MPTPAPILTYAAARFALGFLLISLSLRNLTAAEPRPQVRVGEALREPAADRSWEPWLDRKLLPAGEGAAMMHRFLETQLVPLPLPASREDWLSRREGLRREILTVLGMTDLLPATWDLALQSKGTLPRDGFRIEKFTFESYPGLAVPALLYVPNGVEGRVPGIVSISGHTPGSKAADYVQQRNVNLALRGCVVLAYDYYGYGDRKTGDNPSRPVGANGHDIRSFSFTRRSATALEVLDAIRAVDVLAARPEVDPARIGFTGESGGANTTYWMAALDPRVKLAVPVCSVTSYDYWIRTDANWDWHQRPPGIRRLADIGTLLALHAPNPLLVISSQRGTDDDEFPLDEAEKSFQWAKHVYRLLGPEDAAIHIESTTAHGYQEDKRAQLYQAVERWLQPPHPHDGRELPVTVERIEDLRCPLPEKNLTFRDVFSQWVKELPRVDDRNDPETLRAFLRERLGWPAVLPAVKAEKVGDDQNAHWSAEFWILQTEPGIRLPAVFIRRKDAHQPLSQNRPPQGPPPPASGERVAPTVGRGRVSGNLTLIPGRDKQAVARALENGRAVLAFDLRALGETRHGTSGRWSRMAGAPWPEALGDSGGVLANWAWFAGRPLAGQWALDMAQASRWAREQIGVTSVSMEAENALGWPALLAGAAAPEFLPTGRVQIPWASLHDQLGARSDSALADVPGILEHLDVPQLRTLWPGGEIHVIAAGAWHEPPHSVP